MQTFIQSDYRRGSGKTSCWTGKMKPHAIYSLVSLCVCATITSVQSLNILGVFPYEGRSHFMLFEPYLRELAKKGHNLTVISHFPQKTKLANYHDISLAGKSPILESFFPIDRSYWTLIQISLFLVKFGTENCKLMMSDENVQNLWLSNSSFDVAVVEQFNSDCALGLAHKLGAPVVGIASHYLMPFHFTRHGFYYNPSYMSNMFLDGGTRPTFYQRIERTILYTYLELLYKYFCQRVDENTISQYFDIPPLEELAQNMKFMLLYQYNVLVGSNILPGNIKEVAGFHVEKPKELPQDLKKFIDESEHGVIYISFGSMLKAHTTPKDKVQAIIDALSELPQRVVWKWDEKTLPGNPKNIYVAPWLPQNDILAHPKVLAFFSHCGNLGTTEAIHHGKPIIGMPVIGDQPGNAALIEESGLGVQIHVNDLTKELLLKKFKTVLTPEFRAKAKLLSRAWHDRPVSPMENAIFWTEYAAKYKNLTFTSAAINTPYYQHMNLDILAISIIFIIVTLFVMKIAISLITSQSGSKRKSD